MVSRPETTKQQQQQHHDWHVIERKASSFCCLLIRVALFFPCCPTLVGSLVESAIRLTWELMAQLILAGSKVMGKGKWASPLVCRFRCALLYIGRGLLLMTRPVLYKSTSSGAFKWRSPWLLERRPSSIRRAALWIHITRREAIDAWWWRRWRGLNRTRLSSVPCHYHIQKWSTSSDVQKSFHNLYGTSLFLH